MATFVPDKGSTSSRTLLMRFSTTILHTFSGLATVALVSLDDVASNFRSVKDCVGRYNRHMHARDNRLRASRSGKSMKAWAAACTFSMRMTISSSVISLSLSPSAR